MLVLWGFDGATFTAFQLIFTKGTMGKIFDLWENVKRGTVKNGYFVPFSPILVPFPSTTSRHTPCAMPAISHPHPIAPYSPPFPSIPPISPYFPDSKSWFGELVSSVAVSADACPIHYAPCSQGRAAVPLVYQESLKQILQRAGRDCEIPEFGGASAATFVRAVQPPTHLSTQRLQQQLKVCPVAPPLLMPGPAACTRRPPATPARSSSLQCPPTNDRDKQRQVAQRAWR